MRFFSFSKQDRLRQRREYLELGDSGIKKHNRYFLMIYSPTQREGSRLGITVTRRVGNAVKRNKIKRLCREQFRSSRHRFTRTVDINVIAKKGVAQLPARRIRHGLDQLFSILMESTT